MNITRCQLMRPKSTEEVDLVGDLLERFSTLNKGGKLNVIKGVYRNLRNLANELQDTRPDISNAIDGILDGHSLSLSHLIPRKLVAVYGGNIFEHDAATGYMTRITLDDQKKHTDIKPLSLEEVKSCMKTNS